jgi:hypothetical protein
MTSAHHNVLDEYIGPIGAISRIAETDRMRSLDPDTMVFTFRGESFNLQEITTAIRETLSSAVRLQAQLRNQMRPEHMRL